MPAHDRLECHATVAPVTARHKLSICLHQSATVRTERIYTLHYFRLDHNACNPLLLGTRRAVTRTRPALLWRMEMLHHFGRRMARPTIAALTSLAATLLLNACASDDFERAPTAAYRCDDGTRFTVRFDASAAQVQWPDGRRATLPQQRAASGMWYAGKGYELRGKGDDATWTEPQKPAISCRAV